MRRITNPKRLSKLLAVPVAASLIAACGSSTTSSSTATTASAGSTGGAGTTALPTTAQFSGSVNVGMSTTLSGAIAELGQSGLDGVKLAIANINSSGGLLGKKINLVSADDAAAPATGASNIKTMILNDKIVAIMGTVSSGVAAAEEPLAAQYHIPLMFLTSNDVSLLTKHFTKYAFSDVPNTVMEPEAAAAYLKHVAGTKQITIGTISPNYNFGHATVQGFLQALKTLGVDYRVISQQWPPLQVTNIAPYLSALVSAKPQYVFNGEFGGDLVTFSTQAAQYGFFNHTKMIAMYTQSVLKALGSTPLPGTIGFDRAAFWAIPGKPMKTFITQYKAAYGGYPGSWAVMGYAAVQSWASAVITANSFSGPAVAASLSGATVSTIEGKLTYRACDHQANVSEYVGPVASGPTSTNFGERLWSSTFTAPANTIMETCAQSLTMRSQG